MKRLPNEAPPVLAAGTAKVVVVCTRCRRRLRRCPGCKRRFAPADSVVCLPGQGTRVHVHPGHGGGFGSIRAAS